LVLLDVFGSARSDDGAGVEDAELQGGPESRFALLGEGPHLGVVLPWPLDRDDVMAVGLDGQRQESTASPSTRTV
jgi:hypothetical protein